MKILVLGSTGFLGTALCAHLIERGHEVAGGSRHSPGRARLDIADLNSVSRRLDGERFDVVVNLSASGVTAGSSSSEEMSEINIDGTRSVAMALARTDVPPWFLHVSSSTEPRNGSAAESEYSGTKAAGTTAISSILLAAELDHSIARLHNVYGPGQPAGRFVADVISNSKRNMPTHLNFPDRIRDFCFAFDVTSALSTLVETREPGSRMHEVGSGTGTSLMDIALLITASVGASCDLVMRPEKASFDPRPELVADQHSLDFLRCTTTLDEGIRQTIELSQGS